MTTHIHAEVLRAIADGVPLSEFELRHHEWVNGTRSVSMADDGYPSWLYEPNDWTILRKHIITKGTT